MSLWLRSAVSSSASASVFSAGEGAGVGVEVAVVIAVEVRFFRAAAVEAGVELRRVAAAEAATTFTLDGITGATAAAPTGILKPPPPAAIAASSSSR
jgi:hypothetical protein